MVEALVEEEVNKINKMELSTYVHFYLLQITLYCMTFKINGKGKYKTSNKSIIVFEGGRERSRKTGHFKSS